MISCPSADPRQTRCDNDAACGSDCRKYLRSLDPHLYNSFELSGIARQERPHSTRVASARGCSWVVHARTNAPLVFYHRRSQVLRYASETISMSGVGLGGSIPSRRDEGREAGIGEQLCTMFASSNHTTPSIRTNHTLAMLLVCL